MSPKKGKKVEKKIVKKGKDTELTDEDLKGLAGGAGSPTAYKPTGTSPTGTSPTGTSPTGTSPTGTSPTGINPD